MFKLNFSWLKSREVQLKFCVRIMVSVSHGHLT
jgi:hypothetical protein